MAYGLAVSFSREDGRAAFVCVPSAPSAQSDYPPVSLWLGGSPSILGLELEVQLDLILRSVVGVLAWVWT